MIVLGMRDYGRGWNSAHFANVAATLFGLPFASMRVYYSTTLPSVLQSPCESGILPQGSQPGPLAVAVRELIKGMCGRVVENAKEIFGELTCATHAAVEFDPAAGRFFLRDDGRSASIANIAEIVNGKRLRPTA